MGETALNAFGQQLVDLTLNKTRYDNWDLQWFVEGPFWRRTKMDFSRDYKQIPDYELGQMKHGKSLKKANRKIAFLSIVSAACVYKLKEQDKKINTLNKELKQMKGE